MWIVPVVGNRISLTCFRVEDTMSGSFQHPLEYQSKERIYKSWNR